MTHGGALVQVFGGRPAFVRQPGASLVDIVNRRVHVGRHGDVSVCVSVHDAYFLRTKAAYRAEILAASRRPGGVRPVLEVYERWLATQQGWYAALGLTMPGWQAETRAPREAYRLNRRGERRAARTHCPHGHLMDAANTYRRPNGCRACRACDRQRHR